LQLNSKDQETLRQYLLGNSPPEESATLEERLLTDGEFFQELLIVEDELVDEYLSGDLSNAERESFEAHFLLTAERQQKIRFSRTLKKYLHNTALAGANESSVVEVAPVPVPVPVAVRSPLRSPFLSFLQRNPIIAYSLAAAVVLVIGVASWTALKNPVSQNPSQVLAVTLTPGLTRDGGEITKVSIPPGTDTLQLKLQLPKTDYSSYRAEVFTSEPASIAIGEGLQSETSPTGKFITVSISTSLVKRDDYSVKLGGKRADGTYEDVTSFVFRVVN
jgi:hypothetical protein